MKTKTRYTFRKENGVYRFYADDVLLRTPKGVEVTSDSDILARRIVKELSRNAQAYTQPSSVLCYHYTCCDLLSEYTKENICKDLLDFTRENAVDDPYLALRHGENAEALVAELEKMLPDFSIRQLVCVMVILCSLDSVALSVDMLNDVIIPSQDDEGDGRIRAFKGDMKKYLLEQGVEVSEAAPFVNSLPQIAEAFGFYFSVKS